MRGFRLGFAAPLNEQKIENVEKTSKENLRSSSKTHIFLVFLAGPRRFADQWRNTQATKSETHFLTHFYHRKMKNSESRCFRRVKG
jgi:hypothetical protein